MIVLAFILAALGLIALLFAGSFRAIFEIVMVWGYHDGYSKKEFENKSKDRNKDGKLSWFELTFPDEPVHRVKRWEMALYGFGSSAITTSLIIFIYCLGWISVVGIIMAVLVAAIPFFAFTGLGFDVYFKNNRPRK